MAQGFWFPENNKFLLSETDDHYIFDHIESCSANRLESELHKYSCCVQWDILNENLADDDKGNVFFFPHEKILIFHRGVILEDKFVGNIHIYKFNRKILNKDEVGKILKNYHSMWKLTSKKGIVRDTIL